MKNYHVYKLTFGMYYYVGDERKLVDKISVNLDGNNVSMPVYVVYDGQHYTEVVTGMQISKVTSGRVPGFGVYELKEIVTIEDYKDLKYYLTIASEHKDEYKIALKHAEFELSNKHMDYVSNHSDNFGILVYFSKERNEYLKSESDKCTSEALGLVEELTEKTK